LPKDHAAVVRADAQALDVATDPETDTSWWSQALDKDIGVDVNSAFRRGDR
jgi:hypothetical protein